MDNSTLRDLVTRVTDYSLAHHNERDPWEKAMAISGVLCWGDEAAIAGVQRWVDGAVAAQNTEGNLNYADSVEVPSGHIRSFTPTAALTSSLGFPLMQFYQRTRREDYLVAARRQAQALVNSPRTSEGGVWGRKEAPELWIDMVYLMCPFLVLYAHESGEEDYIEEAVRQFEVHTRRLIDPIEHLPRHAWCEQPNHFTQSTFWARGNGWLICAAMELHEMLRNHSKRDVIAGAGVRAIEAMARHQDRSGFFNHIIDHPGSKKEASATLMFAYAAARGVRQGLLDQSLLENALRAFHAVARTIEPDGAVPGVAVPPGGPGVPFGSTQFGQGFFLLAAHELREHLLA